MNTKLTMAAALLLVLPGAFAQGTPDPAKAPAAPSAPAYAGRPGGFPGRGGEHGGGDMHFRGGPGMGMDFHGGGGAEARLLPPGTWWRNQEVATRIGLSADQQKHIDQIFLDSRVQLIHMHASLEEEQLRLDASLSASPFNQTQALGEINKLADTRADLEKANAKMLLSIRGVLSADQWTKLQTRPARAEWHPTDNRQGGGPGGRGPAGNEWRGRQGGGPHPPTPPAGQ